MIPADDGDAKYPHLGLSEWPFQTIPDRNFFTFMADRTQAKEDIATVLKSLSRRNSSTIHLLWSWFGAGKTHTLRHVEHLCLAEYPSLIPVYTEMPRSLRNFCDLYRSFAASLDYELGRDTFLDILTARGGKTEEKELRTTSIDMFNAFRMLCTGSDRQLEVVSRWLRAEPVQLNEIRPLGIGKRIITPDDAINAISWIVRLFGMSNHLSSVGGGRVVWMIDEFQQVSRSRTISRGVNDCLHAVFNRCPNAISLFISFSGKPEKSYPDWLSPELIDRIGVQKVIVLPPLTKAEAKGFVRDVLAHFRMTDNYEREKDFFPFQEDTVEMLLELIEEDQHEIRPRSIMQYFAAVLERADPLIEQGKLPSIGRDFAMDSLRERLVGAPRE